MSNDGIIPRQKPTFNSSGVTLNNYGDWLNFEALTYGYTGNYFKLGTPDNRWFRITGTNYWVPSATIYGTQRYYLEMIDPIVEMLPTNEPLFTDMINGSNNGSSNNIKGTPQNYSPMPGSGAVGPVTIGVKPIDDTLNTPSPDPSFSRGSDFIDAFRSQFLAQPAAPWSEFQKYLISVTSNGAWYLFKYLDYIKQVVRFLQFKYKPFIC